MEGRSLADDPKPEPLADDPRADEPGGDGAPSEPPAAPSPVRSDKKADKADKRREKA